MATKKAKLTTIGGKAAARNHAIRRDRIGVRRFDSIGFAAEINRACAAFWARRGIIEPKGTLFDPARWYND